MTYFWNYFNNKKLAPSSRTKHHSPTESNACNKSADFGREVQSYALAKFQVIALLAAIFSVAGSAQADTIRIGGTGSALGVMEVLSSEFAISQVNLKVKILPSLGSGGGIKALKGGAIDLAVSARPLKDVEKDSTLSELYYGRSPVALVTFNDVGINNLSQAEILSIYRDETIYWPEGDPIRFVMRTSSETDLKLFVSYADGLSDAYEAQRKKVGVPTAYTDQENVKLLSEIDGSLGIVTLSQIAGEGLSPTLIALDGVSPSVENLQNGAYKLSKSYWLIAPQNSNGSTAAFLDFVQSERGQEILTATGHVVPEASE